MSKSSIARRTVLSLFVFLQKLLYVVFALILVGSLTVLVLLSTGVLIQDSDEVMYSEDDLFEASESMSYDSLSSSEQEIVDKAVKHGEVKVSNASDAPSQKPHEITGIGEQDTDVNFVVLTSDIEYVFSLIKWALISLIICVLGVFYLGIDYLISVDSGE